MDAVAENGTPGGGITGAYQKAVHLLVPAIWLSALGSIAIIGGFFLLVVPGVIHNRQTRFNEGPAMWHLEGATLPLVNTLPGPNGKDH